MRRERKQRFRKQSERNDKKTIKKARGQIEIREYYQTERILFRINLIKKKEWKGLKSVGIEEKTIKNEGKAFMGLSYENICKILT